MAFSADSGLPTDDYDDDGDGDEDSPLISTLQSPSEFPLFLSEDSQIEDSDPSLLSSALLGSLLHQTQRSCCLSQKPSCFDFPNSKDIDVLCQGSSALKSHDLESRRCSPIEEEESAVDALRADALDGDSTQVTLAPIGNVQHLVTTDDVPCDGDEESKRQVLVLIDRQSALDALDGDSTQVTLAPIGNVQYLVTTDDVLCNGDVVPSNQSSILSSAHSCLQPLFMSSSPTGNYSPAHNSSLTSAQHVNHTEVQNYGFHSRHLRTEPSPACKAVKAQVKNASVMITKAHGKENVALEEEGKKRVADGSWMCPRDSKKNFKAKPHQALLDKWLVKRR